MTTDVQIPYIETTGDGTLTRYPFEFTIIDTGDLFVVVDDVLQVQGIGYTVENLTQAGGDVVFAEAPGVVLVRIIRRTTLTQQINYESFSAFQAEVHEGGLDKVTLALQELINGGSFAVDSEGNPVFLTFDLDILKTAHDLTITNTGGTDAYIGPWGGGLAGVFHGEVSTSIPADGEPSALPDGYVYLEVLP